MNAFDVFLSKQMLLLLFAIYSAGHLRYANFIERNGNTVE